VHVVVHFENVSRTAVVLAAFGDTVVEERIGGSPSFKFSDKFDSCAIDILNKAVQHMTTFLK
jgi:hypothetical protein